ncbi:hypothetical protein VHA_002627 [Grimontia hollisae CIP 101886]|uniref:Uncharacterized protein n=1 Tax=Grimontia hollisae CIP 101886 TaxID=675812 RepID=D0IA52_GRIHO|nr:hypothetical protein VHA_002627 [Grimontia hollisae CIP 101886]
MFSGMVAALPITVFLIVIFNNQRSPDQKKKPSQGIREMYRNDG